MLCAAPSLSAGSTATIVTSGKANLHAPLASGAWTVRARASRESGCVCFGVFARIGLWWLFCSCEVGSRCAHSEPLTLVAAGARVRAGPGSLHLHRVRRCVWPRRRLGGPQALWVWVSDALPLDLVASIHWNDPLDTTYTQTVSYTLPAATATGNFTASLISTDQAQVCLFVFVFVYAPVYVCALVCGPVCFCVSACVVVYRLLLYLCPCRFFHGVLHRACVGRCVCPSVCCCANAGGVQLP